MRLNINYGLRQHLQGSTLNDDVELDEIEMSIQNDKWFDNQSGPLEKISLAIKDEIQLHLYINDSPCGDASIYGKNIKCNISVSVSNFNDGSFSVIKHDKTIKATTKVPEKVK